VDLLETDGSALNQETCHSDHRSVHICRHVKARVNLQVKGYADSSSVLPKIDGLMFRTQLNIIFLAIDLSCCTLSGKFPFCSRNSCHWLRDSLGSCSMKYVDALLVSERRSDDRCPASEIIAVDLRCFEAKSLVRSVRCWRFPQMGWYP